LSDAEDTLTDVLDPVEDFGNDVKDFFKGKINRLKNINYFS